MFTGREFAGVSDRMYYAYITKNHIEDSENGRTLWNAGFYRGSRYAIQTSGELSPHLARFMEFVMWMVERESENDE